jgi:hypothetical protein
MHPFSMLRAKQQLHAGNRCLLPDDGHVMYLATWQSYVGQNSASVVCRDPIAMSPAEFREQKIRHLHKS